MSIMERFWSKVDKGSECWTWTASTVGRGYGYFWTGERNVHAHRFAWEMANGPVPKGLDVCHHCDNPPCVRADHLFIGTRKDNMQDARTKGRVHGQQFTHCAQGHEFTPGNMMWVNNPRQRRCRTCDMERRRRRTAAESQDAAAKAKNVARCRAYRARKKAEKEREG